MYIAAALSTVAIALAAGAATAQELLVRIGHVAPLTGGMADYGRDSENGVRLAVEELNARGVVIGGRRARFALLSEDDASEPRQGTLAAQKLCDTKVAGIVGHLNSGTTIPAAKIYSECGIPHITVSATNPQLTRLGYSTTFRTTPDDNTLGAGVAMYAAEQLKLKSVAVIDDRTAYGHGVAEVFKKTAHERGLKIVAVHHTSDKATDFTTILTAIRAKKPDAVFFGGLHGQAGPMLRQMAQLGMNGVWFLGGDGFCSPDLAQLAGQPRNVERVICTEGGTPLEKRPAGVAWRARYDARFPQQFQQPSPYTYDATLVLVDAMQRAASADPKVYARRLFETNYDGLMMRIAFAADGELKQPPMTMYGYRDGRKVALD